MTTSRYILNDQNEVVPATINELHEFQTAHKDQIATDKLNGFTITTQFNELFYTDIIGPIDKHTKIYIKIYIKYTNYINAMESHKLIIAQIEKNGTIKSNDRLLQLLGRQVMYIQNTQLCNKNKEEHFILQII